MSQIRRIVKPELFCFLGYIKICKIFPIFWGRKNYNICWKKTVMMMMMMIHPSINHHIQHPSYTFYVPLLQLLKTKMGEIRGIMNPGVFLHILIELVDNNFKPA
jgi:hypothetical protein